MYNHLQKEIRMAYKDDPEVFDQAFELYKKGDFQRAYDLLSKAASDYPEHKQRIFEWRFDIAARMGKFDLAEDLLEEALNAGYFYSEFSLRKDEDLQGLQGRPHFEALVQRNFAMMAEEQKHSAPRLELFNRGVEEKSTLPLLLALHGNNSNIFRFREHWESLRGSPWLVALAQSSQVSGKGLYSWNNLEIAEREVREHFRQLIGAFSVDPQRVLIGGFSKGAHIAILAAVQEWVRIKGFIAVAPYIGDPAAWEPLLEKEYDGALRGCFLLGEEDEMCTPGALALSEIFLRRGIHCMVKTFPGVGHDFPPDFEQLIWQVLDFLNE
jgi:predicted esterase